MSIILENYTPADKKVLKPVYTAAFPAEERAPFYLISSRAKKGRAELLIARENGKFTGFAYLVCLRDMVYLFYLAVDEKKRGRGYGGEILRGLRERYKGRRIFLAREQLDETADNYPQRVSRREFYLKAGFEDQPLTITEATVTYDVMSIGGRITPDEYRELISGWAGRLLMRFVDMRLDEKGEVNG